MNLLFGGLCGVKSAISLHSRRKAARLTSGGHDSRPDPELENSNGAGDMIRKTLLAAGILAMAGCAQDTSNKGVGFGTSIGQPQLAAVQRQPPAPAPAGAAISGARLDVPTYTIQSRSYRKRGKSKGLRTAAGQTRAVGMGMFSAPEEKIVEIEDYRLGLKHVRYDAHDFIVVSFRGGGGLFGAYSRPWQNQTRAHAEAATNCSIVDGWYASGAHMAPAKIYALSC